MIFEETIGPYLQEIERNIRENVGLVNARDILLPKLLSGEIAVDSDAVMLP